MPVFSGPKLYLIGTDLYLVCTDIYVVGTTLNLIGMDIYLIDSDFYLDFSLGPKIPGIEIKMRAWIVGPKTLPHRH